MQSFISKLPQNIPSLPTEKLMDDKTNDLSDTWRNFFDVLINFLQTNFSSEGVVFPTLTGSASSGNIQLVQNNNNQQSGLLKGYTCQYGTGIYNSTANSIMFAINNGSNAPIFKTVTLT